MANQEIEGLSVRADMEGSSLKQGLQNLNSQLKSVKSEFTLAQAGVKGFADSLEGMRAKSENLGKQINIQSNIVDNLKQAYERTQTAVNNTINKQNELKEAMASNKSQYQEAIKLHGEESDQAKTLAAAYKKLEEQYTKNETKLNRNNMALANAETKLNHSVASLRNMQAELEDTNTAIARQESGWQSLANTLGDISNKLTTVGDKMGKFGDAMTKNVTAPIIALGTASTLASMTYEDAMAKMQAQTGATAEEMQNFKNIVQSLYDNNRGQGFDDLATSVAEIRQQTNLSGKALEDFTNNALVLRDTFDYDIRESTRAAVMMMQQFGVSSEKAFDLLGKASQKGLDKNGNLLDSVNEYSVHFKQLGFDAEEMFNMLSNGASTGVFDIDKLGDAVKEFGIRAQDGSNTTVEGFKLLGLNANEMRAAFATGGDTAQSAFNKVVKAIDQCNDKVKLNTAGVNLFGTMWEDMGVDAVRSLADINGEFSNTNDVIENINSTLYNTTKQEFESFRRDLSEVGVELGETLLPLLKDGVGVLKGWTESFKGMDEGSRRFIVSAAGIIAVVGPLASGIGGIIKVGGTLASGVSKVSGALAGANGLNAVISKSTALINPYTFAIGALGGALLIWKNHSDNLKASQQALHEQLLQQAKGYAETSSKIEDLKNQYKDINKSVTDEKEKKELLTAIQEQLIKSYGAEYESIDLVNGKYDEQLKKLSKIAELKYDDAKFVLEQEVTIKTTALESTLGSKDFLANEDFLFNDSQLENKVSTWNKALKEIEKSTEGFMTVYTGEGGIQLLFDKNDVTLENADKYKETLKESMEILRSYGINSGEAYDAIYDKYNKILQATENVAEAERNLYELRYKHDLSEVADSLNIDLSKATVEQTEKIKKAFVGMIGETDVKYKSFVDSMLTTLPKVGKAIDDNLANKDAVLSTQELAESLSVLKESLEDVGKITNTFSSDLATLEKAIEKVKSGGKLSGEEIIALKEKYSELNVKINESTGERYIELGALEKLRAELPNLSKAQIESEKARTETAIKSAKERMKIYMQEQNVLKGLVSYNSKTGNLDLGSIPENIKSNLFVANPQIKAQYDQALAEAQKIKDMERTLSEFDKALDNIDTISNTRGSSASSSSNKESPLDKALESFEKSKKIRAIGLNEEMAQLQKIKSAYAKTAEDKIDIEEYMYNNYLDIMERKRSLGQLSYDNEIKMYEEALNKYTFNEYQKAEVSSKLLDTKIEKSKEWIEQEKYYGRLSLEEEKKAYERIAEYSKQSAEYKKEMAKEIYRVEKELKEQQEELEKEKREAVKKTVEANIKAKEEEYNKTIAMIEDECNKKVEAYQAQIDALQEQYDKEEELQKQQEYDEKIADLEERMKGARTQEEFEKLAEELNNTQQAKRDYTRQQQLKSDKALLQDKIDQAKNEASIAKNLEKEKLDAYKETQNKMLEESTSIQTSITEMLKKQLEERDSAFLNSLAIQLAAANTLRSAFSGLSLGGIGGITSGISGMTLAAASNKLKTTGSNNYNSPSYNNTSNTTNANMQVTNIIKNASDINTMMNQITTYIQKLNRAKGLV